MKYLLCGISGIALLATGGTAVLAQSVNSAVGGYSFEDAAKESPDTKNFHSADGHLTFAIVTHTAGNGFFDPVYIGAQVAANAFGINLVRLGSEAAVDDIPREIEILNQIIQDPTIDGLILTTPQQGAYDDIVKKMLDQGIPVATTNSFDPTIYDRNGISHTGQSASAAAIGGEALAKCIIDSGKTSGSIIFPSQTTAGNVEVNQRVTFAFNAVTAALDKAGVLANFTIDAGPENIGIPVNDNDIASSIVTYLESRGDVVGVFGSNGGGDAGDRRRGYPGWPAERHLLLRLRSRTQAAGRHPHRRADGLARAAALPPGLLAGDAALPADRPRRAGRQRRHARPAGDQGRRRQGRQALRELALRFDMQLRKEDPPSASCSAERGNRRESGPLAIGQDTMSMPALRKRLPLTLVGGWEVGIIIFMLLLYVAAALINPKFFGSGDASLSVLRDASRYGVMAVGMTFVIVNKDLDLSVGSIYGLVATVFSVNYSPALGDSSLIVAILWAVAAGLLVGVVNGTLVTVLKVPAFIATLTMLFIGRGLVTGLSGGKTISFLQKANSDPLFFAIGENNVLGLQQPDPDLPRPRPPRRGGAGARRAGATRPSPPAATSWRRATPACRPTGSGCAPTSSRPPAPRSPG